MDLPSANATLELSAHYGRLRARLHAEIGQPRLVLPTNEYFPDRFDGSQAAATRLVHRMQTHARIQDIPIRVVIADFGTANESSCSSGACSTIESKGNTRLELDSEGWTLTLSPAELAHPVALTGTVARALGTVFLEETRPDSTPLPQPLELYGELSAVLLGFGVLLLESSHLYTKACSGPRVTQLTLLTASELALLVALFASEHQLKLKPALKASSLTQRSLLNEAQDLLRANPQLLQWILHAKTSDPAPAFALNEAKPSLLAAVFAKFSAPGKEAASDDLEAWLNAPQLAPAHGAAAGPRKHSAQAKPDDGLKALVAEALEANAAGH